jgi:type III restriction enzyme
VDSIFSDRQLPDVGDDRKTKINPLNANFDKKEFKELWNRINMKAVYSVRFDSAELIRNCIDALDKELHVTRLQYTIQRGIQSEQITESQLSAGTGFELTETSVETQDKTAHSIVSYDLIGKLAEYTYLTRKTIAQILRGVKTDTFDNFARNPEQFISETSRIINEQKATIIIERLSYDRISENYDTGIFTAGQTRQDFSRASKRLRNHIYDYAIVDSAGEQHFVDELDTCNDVVVYAKLPRGFLIPTPVGSYNPDWAISFREGTVKHIYFVAETKGSMSSMQLRGIEDKKIECARRFFEALNERIDSDQVRYDVVTDFGKLMEIVKS